jgi:hypothetical protein
MHGAHWMGEGLLSLVLGGFWEGLAHVDALGSLGQTEFEAGVETWEAVLCHGTGI